jgi:hypothetical protein
LVVAAVMSLLLFGGIGSAAATSGRLGNTGFFQPVAGILKTCGGVPSSVGNWEGYTQSTAAGQGPSIVAPKTASARARFVGVAGSRCVGGGWYQDVAYTSGNSFEVAVGVFPAFGTQYVAFFEGLNHATGTSLSEDDVIIKPGSVVFHMWGQSVTAKSALTYDNWYRIKILADPTNHSATLGVANGVLARISNATQPAGATVGTVFLGHRSVSDTSSSDFQFDNAYFGLSPG